MKATTWMRLGFLVLFLPVLPGCRASDPADSAAAPGASTPSVFNIVLGRPTDSSIAASVLVYAGTEIYAEYGTASGAYAARSRSDRSAAGEPIVIEMTGLQSDTRFFYRLRYRLAGETDFRSDSEQTFQTRRASGRTFCFGVQGDSHPERQGKMYSPDLYTLNMKNAAAGQLDFYFALGDDFSIERLIEKNELTQENVNAVYLNQRNFFAIPGPTLAVFLVNGNHELAAGYLLNSAYETAYANAPIFAGKARLAYFPLPAPDGFYTGDDGEVPGVGLPRDYYAWEWGDALFAVIDPYWHSPVPVSGNEVPGITFTRDQWEATIGDSQYAWLEKTLRESHARYKFVFEHHALGCGRGAAAIAHSYEWGGYNARGTAYEFPSRRPGWSMPIHRLLVGNNVTVFFFGHDHLFAREKVDGVVYQSVPNPADDTYTAFNSDAYDPASILYPGANYDPGYGVIMANSGYLRVTVAAEKVRVEYIRAWLPQDGTAAHPNGEVAFAYEITP
jgi:hypothetical protein